jgi:hypothetical protein
MFALRDYRQTGMPALATVATAEGAWALADLLGIREHACVLPASHQEHSLLRMPGPEALSLALEAAR